MKNFLMAFVLLHSTNAFSQSNEGAMRELLLGGFKSCKMTAPVADMVTDKLMGTQIERLKKLNLDSEKFKSEMGKHCDFATALQKAEVKTSSVNPAPPEGMKEILKEVVKHTISCKHGKNEFLIDANVGSDGSVVAVGAKSDFSFRLTFNKDRPNGEKTIEFSASEGNYTKSISGLDEISVGASGVVGFGERKLLKIKDGIVCRPLSLKKVVTHEKVLVEAPVAPKIEVKIEKEVASNESSRAIAKESDAPVQPEQKTQENTEEKTTEK